MDSEQYFQMCEQMGFEQMGILCFYLQLFREQMGFSMIFYQTTVVSTILLQFIREQVGI